MRIRTLTLLFATTAFLGCTKDPVETGDTADADTDADSDADADADSDADTDSALFSGTLTFTRSINDAVVCDLDVDFRSESAYTGTCTDCDFAFNIDSTVARDDSTASCTHDADYWLLTLQEGAVSGSTASGEFQDPWIAFVSETYGGAGYEGHGHYMEYDTLVFGSTYAYQDPDPATEDVTSRYLSAYTYVDDINGVYGPYASNDYQTLFVSKNLVFDVSVASDEYATVSEDCETAFGDEGTSTVSGGVSATDDLACDGSTYDVYEFTAVADAVIAISVDTTDGTQFGDGYLIVVGPDGCEAGSADDSFVCTIQPPDEALDWCPTWTGTVPTTGAGTYRVVVSTGTLACDDDTSTTWPYRLDITGATDTTLVIAEDDLPWTTTTVDHVVGSGEVP